MSEVNIINNKRSTGMIRFWNKYKERHPNIAQFIVFFILSAGMTVLQLILMPLIKLIFAQTSLLTTSFQVFQLGHNFNFDGSAYYVFDYAAGSLSSGGGGGLGYFLAVQITIGIAQILNQTVIFGRLLFGMY